MAKEYKVKIEGVGQNDPTKSQQPYRVSFSVWRDDIRFFGGILKCTQADIDGDDVEELVREEAIAMIVERPTTAKIIDEITVKV